MAFSPILDLNSSRSPDLLFFSVLSASVVSKSLFAGDGLSQLHGYGLRSPIHPDGGDDGDYAR
jgi:hypothetical protein